MDNDRKTAMKQWVGRVGRPVAGLAGLVALVVWSGGACESKVAPGRVEHQPGIALPGGVRTCTARVERTAASVEIIGTVTSEQRINLSARLSAYVQQTAVSAGDSVTNGQLLVALDDRDIRQQLSGAEAQYRQAESEYQRATQLFEKGAATEQVRQAAESAFQSAKAHLEGARVMATYARIVSPIDGVVTDRRIEVGDLAAPGQILLSVYDPHHMRLEVPIPVRLIPSLPLHREIEVTLDGFDAPLKGVVREIVSEVDPLSRTQLGKVHIEDSARRILPGTYGRIRMQGEPRDAVWVPGSAVYRVGQQELVQVAVNGRVLRRVVRTGVRRTDAVEILSGLEDGETVLPEPIREG
jgi:RND family efflux transporter MFP subunit